MIMTIIILWWDLPVKISRGWHSYPLLLIKIWNVGFCGWIKENRYNYNSMLFVGKRIIYSNFSPIFFTKMSFSLLFVHFILWETIQ